MNQIDQLKAEILALEKENSDLKKRLARYEIDRYPRTYAGAKDYVANVLKWFVYANPAHVADELNRLGFPAYRGFNWSEDKVKRLIKKMKSTKSILVIDVDIDADIVTSTPDSLKRISLIDVA